MFQERLSSFVTISLPGSSEGGASAHDCMASQLIVCKKELFWFMFCSCIRKQSSKVVADPDRYI